MKSKYLIFFFLFIVQLSFGQKYFTIAMGNAVKKGLGTTYIAGGFQPIKQIEFYAAPSWGIWTGGVALFCGTKINILSKYRFYPNAELTYRHSCKTIVSYENHTSGGTESYKIPSCDFFVSGVGLNFNINKSDDTEERGIINLTGTYSYALNNNHITNLSGPYSQDGEASAKSRLLSGFGFTLSIKYTMSFTKTVTTN